MSLKNDKLFLNKILNETHLHLNDPIKDIVKGLISEESTYYFVVAIRKNNFHCTVSYRDSSFRYNFNNPIEDIKVFDGLDISLNKEIVKEILKIKLSSFIGKLYSEIDKDNELMFKTLRRLGCVKSNELECELPSGIVVKLTPPTIETVTEMESEQNEVRGSFRLVHRKSKRN